eukprot:6487349-Amphidinium_carterae.1
MSQQQVRDRTAKLWRAGASCFGGTLHHWAAVNQVSPDAYITQLCSSGWGSAADACIFANSLQASCYIYDSRGSLIVSSPCSRSLFNMNFRLAGEHYTVVNELYIEHAQRHAAACYWYRSRASSSWRLLHHLPSYLRSHRVPVAPMSDNETSTTCSSSSSRSNLSSKVSTSSPTCSVALLEMRLLQFQQLCAGGWLRRSSLCSTHSLVYLGGNSLLPPDPVQGRGRLLRTQAQEAERRELLFERQRLLDQFRLLDAERRAVLPLFHIPYWNSTGWSELYDAVTSTISRMLLLTSGLSLLSTYTNTGINFYSDQPLIPIGIGQAYVWVMSDDIRVRAVTLDMLSRAVPALDLQLSIMVTGPQPRVVAHPHIDVPRLIDFNTSWMSTVFGSYAIITDPMHHVLFLLHRRRPLTPSLRSSAHVPVLHLGGTRVSEVIRFDTPGRVQHFSGVQFQAKYYSAGHLHVGINAAPPP